MILSAKLKAQVKTLLIKLIRDKKTSIIGMKEKAYDYVRERLPKWLVFIFDGYFGNRSYASGKYEWIFQWEQSILAK